MQIPRSLCRLHSCTGSLLSSFPSPQLAPGSARPLSSEKIQMVIKHHVKADSRNDPGSSAASRKVVVSVYLTNDSIRLVQDSCSRHRPMKRRPSALAFFRRHSLPIHTNMHGNQNRSVHFSIFHAATEETTSTEIPDHSWRSQNPSHKRVPSHCNRHTPTSAKSIAKSLLELTYTLESTLWQEEC